MLLPRSGGHCARKPTSSAVGICERTPECVSVSGSFFLLILAGRDSVIVRRSYNREDCAASDSKLARKHLLEPPYEIHKGRRDSKMGATRRAMLGFTLLCVLVLVLVADMAFAQFGQKDIVRVQMMPNIPEPFQMRDWKEAAREFDKLVFDFDAEGDYLPLIQWDRSHLNFADLDTFFLPSFVGDIRQEPGSQEAINTMAAVLGASVAGIDKSEQNGQNWVLMQKQFYNIATGEDLILNNVGTITGGSFWYEIFPEILFYGLISEYPKVAEIKTKSSLDDRRISMLDIMYETANRYYEAVRVMGADEGVPDFNWTSFDFQSMQPVDNGEWQEPDAAGGIAWLQYMAYRQFGEDKFLESTKSCLQFLEELERNPLYEVLLPFGAYTAARINAEEGTAYDVAKLLNWSFGPSDVRPGWGVITDRWGDYDVYGIQGSMTDGRGYAFLMSTFDVAAALVPIVRYDPRYARTIGKWMLNLANNARLFYFDYLPEDHQSSPSWGDESRSVIGYEGLRRGWEGRSPYATGDAIRGGWSPVDYGMYGSSHVGLLGGLVSLTDEEHILQLDLVATDFFHDRAYPSYLYYNPHHEPKVVEIEVGPDPVDLYNATTKCFIKTGVSKTASFTVPADGSAVIVIVPAGGEVSFQGNKMMVNDIVVDYQRAMLAIHSPAPGQTAWGQFPVRVDLPAGEEFTTKAVTVMVDGEVIYAEGSLPEALVMDTEVYGDETDHLLVVRVEGTNGVTLQDEVTFEVDNRPLVIAEANDLSKWESYGPAPARLEIASYRATIIEDNPDGDHGAIISPPILLDFGRNPVFLLGGVFPRADWAFGLEVEDDEGVKETYYIPFSADGGEISFDLVDGLRQAKWGQEGEEVNLNCTYSVRLLIETRGEASRLSFFQDNIDLVYRD